MNIEPSFSSIDNNDKRGQSNDPGALDELLRQIGVARFAGRISAGFIDEIAGYEAIERLVQQDIRRPFLSKIGQLVFCRPDSYNRQ